MMNFRQIAIGAAVMLAASWTAYAQEEERPDRRGRGASAVEAARDALGITEEQIDQIREIRRERPPRGQSREDRQAWAQEQRSKVEGVLNADQKAKLAELEKAREQMRALAGAAALGLVPGGPGGPGPRSARPGGNRPGRGFANRGGRRGPGRNFRGRNRGPDRRGRGFRDRGRGFGPGRGRNFRDSRRGRNARAGGPGPSQARPGFRARQNAPAPGPRPGSQPRGRRVQSDG